jgi:hypothetical protein
MLNRRSFVAAAAAGIAMPYVARAGSLTAGAAAVNPADFALGTGWSQRWKRFPGSPGPSQIQKVPGGVQLYGRQTLVSRKIVTKTPTQRLRINFTAIDLNGFSSPTEIDALLLYTMLRGPGTKQRPVNVSAWNTSLIGQPTLVEAQPGVSCYMTTLAPRGVPADWAWRVRMRMFLGNGRHPRVIENEHNPPAPSPGPFVFERGVAYECTQTIVGQTFRWKQRRIDTNEAREMVVIDPRFDDFLSGNIAWRPERAEIAFQISGLSVTVT